MQNDDHGVPAKPTTRPKPKPSSSNAVEPEMTVEETIAEVKRQVAPLTRPGLPN